MKNLLILCFLLLANLVPAHAELPDPMRFSVAMEIGDLKQARAWLDEGLDPDFEGHLIGTGLMIGAWEGNIPLMELFLERGADLQRSNRFGETALMLAAWKNRRVAMQWLLDHGAKPNRPEREWTALHYAAFAGHANLVDDLLGAGADVNARSTNGSTVVMMAAREGHAALAERLLVAGANPLLKNDYDDNAVAWAMRQGNYDIAKTFTSAENFAELVRQAADKPLPPPQRSLPAPDAVDELLRKARLAEMDGKGEAALAIYQQAWNELKTRQSPLKVSAGETAQADKKSARTTKASKPPKALIIRAKRGEPEKQSLGFSYGESSSASADELLEAARTAEAAGDREKALALFRQAAGRIKGDTP